MTATDLPPPDVVPRRAARWTAIAAGLVLAGLIAVLVVARPGDDESASSHLLGRPAPEVRSTTLDGGTFDLARRKGSWVVLNFFNSTCVPCIQEHPEIVRFVDDQRDAEEPVEFYTIINDDSDGAVRDFFAANGGTWPLVRDDDGTIAVSFGVAKVPETWVVDANGFVRLRILGAVTADFLTERIAEARAPGGAP
jgi:cytochrome c biogenesis protein CcmG/thiol:disulfide interchange protein DsbE